MLAEEALRQRIIRNRTVALVANARQGCRKSCGIRRYFPNFVTLFCEESVQARLRCRAKNDRAAVVVHQLGKGFHARFQILHRYHLGFVKQDDAIGDIVQLSAPRRLRRV